MSHGPFQEEMKRLVRNCDSMLTCFSEQKDWMKISREQRLTLHRALSETLERVEEKLHEIERQIHVAARRGDSRSVNDWDLWRAQLRTKRNGLEEIASTLRPRDPREYLSLQKVSNLGS